MADGEGSDDTSENELLDKSLSVWKGKSGITKEKFEPIPLDLYTASSLGHYECVKHYITRGEVDLDKRNLGGWTAIMYACYIGHDNIVSLLLEAGVNVNIRNHKGETPLMLAASCGNESVGYFLVHQDAELEARDERGWTALFHATYSGHQNMVRFLLEQGANMNAVEQSMGMTPFMEAAAEGHEIILQLFLRHGVNVNAKAFNGDTARSLALISGNMKIVSLIDNHVMPITSLRAEPGLEADLSSSDDAYTRTRTVRGGRVRPALVGGAGGGGGGPSIRDGPEAIARLIDRTRDVSIQKSTGNDLVPKGYVTFPDEGTIEPRKLSYRDVTSPINPEDYKLDSSGRESFENEDDTNAFSKTGALTIKSSSGSSGGLAAALGIRREDSLDSDEFPHESSCDSHPHGNSGDSSSEEGLEDGIDAHVTEETLKQNRDSLSGKHDGSADRQSKEITSGEGTEKKKLRSKKSKENLTKDKVNEIEVMKNSVSEWIDSVQDTHPVPENNLDSPGIENDSHAGVDIQETAGDLSHDNQTCTRMSRSDHTRTDSGTVLGMQVIPEKPTALKPEYHHKHKSSKDITEHYGYSSYHTHGSRGMDEQQKPSSQIEQKHLTNSELFDQVANSVKHYGRRSSKDFLQQNPILADTATNSMTDNKPMTRFETNATPVSALNVLNTHPDSNHSNAPANYHSHHQPLQMPPPPGFPVPFNAYQMFPQGTGANFTHGQAPPSGLYHPGVRESGAQQEQAEKGTEGDAISTGPSSNTVFMEKMRDSQPTDLATLLDQLGLSKHMPTFEEQDVDLQVFLSLTDNDLKEIGIKLFGPRKKMTNAIARWHSKARIAIGELEHAYADRLEGEMQEMGVQLQLACEQLETLKAQVKQEQQLRNVTETCLMEERAAWQHVQRIIIDTRQQCEDFKDIVKKLKQYVTELKSRVPPDTQGLLGVGGVQQKRPIRGAGAMKDDAHDKMKSVIASDQLPMESVLRKVDYYMMEVQSMLGNVTLNADRLLGRNTQSQSPERGYT